MADQLETLKRIVEKLIAYQERYGFEKSGSAPSEQNIEAYAKIDAYEQVLRAIENLQSKSAALQARVDMYKNRGGK